MSLEAFGDEGWNDGGTDDRVGEIGSDCFRKGAQVCREMMARFVEAVDPKTAESIRLNWNPKWGTDPGRIGDAEYDQIREGFDPFSVA